MNYVEIIECRSSMCDYEILSRKLSAFLHDLNEEYEDCCINLYRHLAVETDWSFHVHYHAKVPLASPSPAGVRIASTLKEFGLVHHSVWSEEVF